MKAFEGKVVNIWKTETFDQYIGRAGHGQDGYFGNPYSDGTREENIGRYEKYFYHRIEADPEFKRRVLKLKGKVLGCFCSPKACHGDVIIKYLNNLK